jgi:hypothetical protein
VGDIDGLAALEDRLTMRQAASPITAFRRRIENAAPKPFDRPRP